MLSSPLSLLFSSSCIIFLSSFTVHWRITSCHMFKDLLCYYPFSFSLLSFFSTCFTFTAITFYDQDTIKPAKPPPIHGFRSVFIFKQQQISSTNTTHYAQAHMQYQLLLLAMFTDCVSLLILTFFNTFPPITPFL